MTLIRKAFIRNIVLYMLLALVVVLIIMLFNFADTKKQLAASFISKPLQTIEVETEFYFSPIEKTLKMAMSHGTAAKYKLYDSASVNAYFVPIMLQYPQISSIAIADIHGYEYNIIQMDDEWHTRTVHHSTNDATYWANLLIPELISDSSWLDHNHVNPTERPWHKGALKNRGSIYWPHPYTFNTNHERGITASCSYPEYSTPDSIAVLTVDLKLNDLYKFVSKVHISESGFGFVLDSNRELAHASLAENRSEYFDQALKIFLKNNGSEKTWKPFSFEVDNETWWAQFKKSNIVEGQDFVIGVVLPGRDIMTELNRTQNVIYIGITTTLLLIIAIFWTHRHSAYVNKLLNRSNLKIRQQSVVVLQKNIDLLDSIHAAKRLQKAVLPPKEKLNEVIPNSFILFEPKDVVSGDFYWVKDRSGTQLFTVGDCTGHGVPGAFMSILGMDILKLAVSNNRDFGPGQLLGVVQKELVQRLVSYQEKTMDGMDMALCSFDRDTRVLKFAGAYFNLFLVRNRAQPELLDITTSAGNATIQCTIEDENHRLYLIKGNRIPIGYMYPGEITEFCEYSIKIRTGDKVYLTSDGLTDQFGGSKGKKFGQQRFRSLLLEIQNQDIKSQGEEINKVFINWKKEKEQVDDVCIMGVQLIESFSESENNRCGCL